MAIFRDNLAWGWGFSLYLHDANHSRNDVTYNDYWLQVMDDMLSFFFAMDDMLSTYDKYDKLVNKSVILAWISQHDVVAGYYCLY
jgi:hypothetical protein